MFREFFVIRIDIKRLNSLKKVDFSNNDINFKLLFDFTHYLIENTTVSFLSIF